MGGVGPPPIQKTIITINGAFLVLRDLLDAVNLNKGSNAAVPNRESLYGCVVDVAR